ncbi:monovalent cation/H+ antiporter complex subunit F [Streptomyces sp. NPDC127079]|uniref:monovalent cation/H+ antiporter complex subunit F n=1 Tax=Streptomyces sp. NPDC127079 TaxID=3347132 RepID=UPI00365E583B
MNGWILAATVLLAGGAGTALWGVTTGPLSRRVVAQNLSTSVVCASLLLLAQGYGRTSYVDLGLLLAVLGPVGTLVFARLLADDLTDDRTAAWGLTWTTVGVDTAVVVALCVATGPSRAMAKLLVIGALLIGGNVVASRALSGGFQGVRGG